MARKTLYLLVALATFALGTFLTLDQQKEETSTQKETAATSDMLNVLNNETPPDYGCFFGSHQTSVKNQLAFIDFDDLKVNNIGLDSKEYLLTKKFGNALTTAETRDSFNKSIWFKDLSYEGIKFELLSDQNKRNYKIYGIEITSPNLITKSGIKVGDDIKDISRKIDTSNYRETESSKITSLRFENIDGYAVFDFQNNKLVRIHWRYHLNLL
jgi:hypothetical protein